MARRVLTSSAGEGLNVANLSGKRQGLTSQFRGRIQRGVDPKTEFSVSQGDIQDRMSVLDSPFSEWIPPSQRWFYAKRYGMG